MKITCAPRRSGSALMLALIAFLFMAGIGGAIFSLTLAGQRTTIAASFGDGSYHVAEAGIDDAINKMRAYVKNPDNKEADYYDPFVNPVKDDDGNIVNRIEGTIRGGSYTVTISPILEAGVEQTYTISSVGKLAGQKRGIRTTVSAEEKPGATRSGLFGKDELTTGGGLITDSYKSTDEGGALYPYSKQAFNTVTGVKPLLAGNKGGVGSNGPITSGGSGWVNGTGTPGPGYKISDGDKSNFLSTSTTDTELELTFTELSTPKDAELYTYPPKGTVKAPAPPAIINATAEKSVYKITEITKKLTINTGDGLNVKVYVSGDIKLTAAESINITGSGTVSFYQNAADASKATLEFVGKSLVNSTGKPGSVNFYTNVEKGKFAGTSDFFGVVYAPSTDISMIGGNVLYGSVVGKTIKASGTVDFHYDERLAETPTGIIEINVKSVDLFVPSSKD